MASLDRGGLQTTLTDAQLAELKDTATKLCAPGKGFLASDESAGPWLRAGHVEAAKIADTAETRAAYRAMLYTTPGLSEYISGVILHQETLYQQDAKGNEMVDLITKNGMLAGLKVDKGYDKVRARRRRPPAARADRPLKHVALPRPCPAAHPTQAGRTIL